MGGWQMSSSSDPRALAIVDGTGIHEGHGPHYSRRTPGSKTFTGVGQEVVLVHESDCAVWAVVRQRVPGGTSKARPGVGDTLYLAAGGEGLTFTGFRPRKGKRVDVVPQDVATRAASVGSLEVLPVYPAWVDGWRIRGERATYHGEAGAENTGRHVWRNMLFRRLPGCPMMASGLIRTATQVTYTQWVRRYGALPPERLRTEVGLRQVRSSNPGYCYLMAGYTKDRVVRGKLYLWAPAPGVL